MTSPALNTLTVGPTGISRVASDDVLSGLSDWKTPISVVPAPTSTTTQIFRELDTPGRSSTAAATGSSASMRDRYSGMFSPSAGLVQDVRTSTDVSLQSPPDAINNARLVIWRIARPATSPMDFSQTGCATLTSQVAGMVHCSPPTGCAGASHCPVSLAAYRA